MTIDTERQTGRTTGQLIGALKIALAEAQFSQDGQSEFVFVLGRTAEFYYLRNMICDRSENFGYPITLAYRTSNYSLTLGYGRAQVRIDFRDIDFLKRNPDYLKAYRGPVYFDHAANRG